MCQKNQGKYVSYTIALPMLYFNLKSYQFDEFSHCGTNVSLIWKICMYSEKSNHFS